MAVNFDLLQLIDLFNIIPDAVLIVDNYGKIIEANEQVSVIFGYGPEELYGEDVEKLLPVRFHTKHRQHRKTFTRHPSTRPMGRGIDIWARRKDSSEFPADIKLSSVSIGTGEDVVCCVVRDNTAQYEVQKAVSENNLRFRQIAENVNEMFWLISADGRELLYVSPNFETTTGRSLDVLFEDPEGWRQIFHPDDIDGVFELFDPMRVDVASGKNEVESRIIQPDGTLIWVWLRFKPIFDDLGNLIARVGTGIPITEQKEAEEALKASESRFRSLWDNAADAVVLSDPKGNIIEVNNAYFKLFGYAPDEVVNKNFSVMFPESFREIAQKAYLEIFSNPDPETVFEAEIQRADGSRGFIESRIDFIKDENGRRTALLSIIREVTERKQVQANAKILFNAERDQRLRAETLVEATLALTNHTSFSAILNEILKQMQRLTSFKTANIALIQDGSIKTAHFLGYGDQSSLPQRIVRPIADLPLISKLVKTGQPFILADVQKEPNWIAFPGSEWIRSFLAVPIMLHKEVIGVLRVDSAETNTFSEQDVERLTPLANAAAIALSKAQMLEQAQQEIHERIVAEEALKESLSLIEQIKQDWETTADSFDQVIALLDVRGNLIRINRTAQTWGLGDFGQLLGNSLHEVLHQECPNPNCYFDKYWTEVWPKIIAGEHNNYEVLDTVLHRYLRIQLRPITSNQRHRQQWSNKSPIRSAIAVIHDITEQKQVEEAILHTQKLESLGILAGGIAHDFNNLLASILSENSLALLRLPEGNPARTNIERANQATERAADLTRQMLAYTGKSQFKEISLNLNELVQENMLLLETSIPRNIELVTDLAAELPQVLADAGQIQQVVMNLILNAAEAYEEQPGQVVLSTWTETIGEQHGIDLPTTLKPGEYVCFSVQDNGTGMDEATLSRIFDPFFTTKFTGRGLGLSAVSGIVRQHEGDILVRSKEGQGTIFIIYLPISVSEPVVETPPTLIPFNRTASILIIDDELSIRIAVADFLRFLEQTVFTAEDGLVGLETYKKHANEIDLVILDLTMPAMSGKETLIELHKLCPTLPVLLLSGFSEEEALEQIEQSDLVDFLQKPFRLPVMLQKLNDMLNQTKPA